ncbi:MAG: GTPase Era [Mariprofundaceae bacterium]|nr:GTPase Era [Mariprofundaceae bacterium]
MTNAIDKFLAKAENYDTGNEKYRCGSVALLGRPNVGKSTLMNKIIGEKVAIVTPKPQTTRQRILGIHSDEEQQIIFIDTPGIHKGSKQLNRNMVKVAYAAAEEADVLCIMQDVSKPMDRGTQVLIERFSDGRLTQPRIHVLNKIDQSNKDRLLPRLQEIQELDPTAAAYVPISARKGAQVGSLLKEIAKHLPTQQPLYDPTWFTDQSQKQMAGEYVREQVFLAMYQEIPFQTAVEIEEFIEVDNKIEISAVILVGTERHKPMIIGKNGDLMKHIGIKAREGLEKLLGRQVNLKLWVRVQKDWFEKQHILQDLGL